MMLQQRVAITALSVVPVLRRCASATASATSQAASRLVVAKLLRARVVDLADALRASPKPGDLQVFAAPQLTDPARRAALLETLSSGHFGAAGSDGPAGERFIVLPRSAAEEVFGAACSVPALEAGSGEEVGGALLGPSAAEAKGAGARAEDALAVASAETSTALAPAFGDPGSLPSMSLAEVAAAMTPDPAERVLQASPQTGGSAGQASLMAALPESSLRLFEAAAGGSLQELREALDTCQDGDLDRRHPQHGGTPLHVAAGLVADAAVAVVLVAELCERGADVDARAANSSTPLHWAAGAGNADSVMELLRRGADPALATHTWKSNVFGKGSGQTPAHWAAESGHEACVEALMGSSALAPFLEDERGQRPADLAYRECHDGIAAALREAAEAEMVCVAVSTEAHVHRVVQPLGGDSGGGPS